MYPSFHLISIHKLRSTSIFHTLRHRDRLMYNILIKNQNRPGLGDDINESSRAPNSRLTSFHSLVQIKKEGQLGRLSLPISVFFASSVMVVLMFVEMLSDVVAQNSEALVDADYTKTGFGFSGRHGEIGPWGSHELFLDIFAIQDMHYSLKPKLCEIIIVNDTPATFTNITSQNFPSIGSVNCSHVKPLGLRQVDQIRALFGSEQVMNQYGKDCFADDRDEVVGKILDDDFFSLLRMVPLGEEFVESFDVNAMGATIAIGRVLVVAFRCVTDTEMSADMHVKVSEVVFCVAECAS